MPHVVFTANLRRHVDCHDTVASGDSVRKALDDVFAKLPQVRSYVLDEHGRLRRHMVIFIDGRPIHDRDELTDVVESSSEIYIMQALSGG